MMNMDKGFFVDLYSDDKDAPSRSVLIVPTTAISDCPTSGFFILKASEYYKYSGFCLFVPNPLIESYVYMFMAQIGLSKNQALQLEQILVSIGSEVKSLTETAIPCST